MCASDGYNCTTMRSSILGLILLLGATSAAAEDAAEQARTLFKKRSYPQAAALARQVFAQQPDGRAADDLRVLLCKAKAAGADVGEPSESEPLPVGGGVQRPERIAGVNPQFSNGTRRAGDEGLVMVKAVIDRDGCVVDIKLERGLNKYADRDVLRALRTWIFRPASLDGKPVDVSYTLTVSVNLG
jgi:TonB family protein